VSEPRRSLPTRLVRKCRGDDGASQRSQENFPDGGRLKGLLVVCEGDEKLY
jgi:hypothetical protein